MSEDDEHTSEETEAEMNAENHSDEQSKSETSISNNESEQPMLEDEEMPSYISVSSPSRRGDSDVNNTKQQERISMEEDHSRSPYPSDDQGAGSVYVLSSGEESNHPYNDEEEDEYEDSEDLDDMHLENEHGNVMLEDEKEEEEEEDEEDDDEINPLRMQNDDDKDMDAEYEQECFDRASDDSVLTNRLKHYHKERSFSLQDLSASKNNIHNPYINKKGNSLSILRQNYLDRFIHLQENTVMYPVTNKKQTVTPKYQHVQSKVKQYIKNIKEQNRRSVERRIKEQEYITNKNHEENESNDTDYSKPTVPKKTIKDYVEKAIKDLQQEENNEIVENGENNKTDITVTELKHVRRDSEINVYSDIQNEKHTQNCDDRLAKRNGSVDVNAHHIEYQNTFDRNMRFSNMDQSSLVNGHQQTPTLFNLRTLSYEEYMHGTSNNKQREELSEQVHRTQETTNKSEIYTEAEIINVQEMDISNAGCPIKIENVKSICITQDESENTNFAKVNTADKVNTENGEVIQLKAQLNQKDAQFHTLRDAYQKVVAEKLKIKAELDALKESLAKYESESKTCETKAVSVQAETTIEPTPNRRATVTTAKTKQISTSSVASTISSSDQWADSESNLAISLKPPDLSQILNSDDSIVLTDGTPKKTAHPLSRTFLTSSRILQTLSSITQGKSKVESPLVRSSMARTNDNLTDQQLSMDCNSPIQASSSKKRKATDMLGTSTFVQPFKIPHTSIELGNKSHNDATEVEFKHSEEHANSITEQQQNASVNTNGNNSSSIENKVEGTEAHDDSVKCFIYRDDENTKNRSFLIQTEEPIKDRLLDNEKGRIQECGPYLLGNLEVRMSEINGTISVWGKEISQESLTDNEDDMEVSMKPVEKKTCHCWQKTPQTRFNGSPIVCSTNKKQKTPFRFNRSNVSQCSHSLSVNTMKSPFLLDDVGDRRQANHFSPNTSTPFCDNCGSSKCHKEWSTSKSSSSTQEKLHSCCIHHTEFTDKEYNCSSRHEKQKCDDTLNHSKNKFHFKGLRRNSYKNTFAPDLNNHLHENIMNTTAEANEVICKYNTCRHVQNMEDRTSHSRCYNTVRDVSCTCKSSMDNISNHDNSERHTCSYSLLNDGEEDSLIPQKRSNETLETRQRRLSGKRVRGILMDLLKGCRDCRNSNVSRVSKSGLQHKESPYKSPPQIKVSPCPSPEPSNSTQCNDRCFHACARQIKSQLEEFRMEMERVRSRSDAILDMLNMLHSVDMN